MKLTILNREDELHRITSEVRALGEREGWPPGLVFRANLILEELGLNIINYGHDEGVHEIEIVLNSEPDSLSIEITDDGRPFNPTRGRPQSTPHSHPGREAGRRPGHPPGALHGR